MADVTLSRATFRPTLVALRAMPDHALSRLAARGDDRAVTVIYERHHQALYRYCRSIVRDPDDAGDALQNTMTNAIRAIGNRGEDVPLKPWLFRIAHNESVSLLRRRRPHEDIDKTPLPSGHGPEEEAETREELRQLVADLQDLPERQRGALVMRELNGLGYETIGETFGVSAAAAKQSVYEARVALHERMEGREMDCEAVRRSVSEGDRRMLRGRKIRAHLRICGGCSLFAEAIPARRASLAMLAPGPSAAASASLLEAVLGSAGGGGGGAGGALAGAGMAGKAATAGLAAKALVVASVAVTAGTAVGVASDRLPAELGGLVGSAQAESLNPFSAGATGAATPGAIGARSAAGVGKSSARGSTANEPAVDGGKKDKDEKGHKEGEQGKSGDERSSRAEDRVRGLNGRRRAGNGPVRGLVEPVKDLPTPLPKLDKPDVKLPEPKVSPPPVPEVDLPPVPKVEPPKLPLP